MEIAKNLEFVGVANLATRAAAPLAGGYEPPLPAPTRHSQFLSGLHIGTRHVGEALSLPK